MTLIAYFAALALLVTSGVAVVGAGLWIASICPEGGSPRGGSS